jgi:outer membrane protein insertion porin family
MNKYLFFSLIFFWNFCSGLSAQQPISIDYGLPKEYLIRDVRVKSNSDQTLDKAVVYLSGLEPGQRIQIPGDPISMAIKRLWKEKTFSDVKMYVELVGTATVDIIIEVKELPRVLKPVFTGVKKGEREDMAGIVKWYRGEVLTEHLLKLLEYRIKDYYIEKGYLDTRVAFTQKPDTTAGPNFAVLHIDVDRQEKIKIGYIHIAGNKVMPTSKIRRKMKDAIVEKSRMNLAQDFLLFLQGQPTPRYIDSMLTNHGIIKQTVEYMRNANRINLFKSSKYVESEWETATRDIIREYNTLGFRDARFVRDTVYMKDGELFADLTIYEGNRYYHRNITWVGNKKYTTGRLDSLLNIRKGTIYNQEALERKLMFNPAGGDISSMYQDEGYLFFQINPVEVMVDGDSIDLEIRMFEGTQARVGRILVTGNAKTNDRVILREIRCRPGDLYSRANIIRSQQALSQLGILNPQTIDIRPKPNPIDGTVDIEFYVEEAPSDQIELSGGWGANQVIGTLGLTLNNFSARNLFRPKTWAPLPAGDGQRLSIRGQSNGPNFQAYNFSFNEPWLGGKKPISFGVFVNHSRFRFGGIDTNASQLGNTSVGLTLGRQLRWPDDYFSVQFGIRYHRYDARNYNLFANSGTRFTGQSNNIGISASISRNSTDHFIFPRSGSMITASVEFTPPYTAISGADLSNASLQERYEWLEYHKWKFKASWFNDITKSKNNPLVLMVRTEFGFLGQYNDQIGITPFERFFLGGDGLTGFNIDGREIIAMRGYPNLSLTPGYNGTSTAAVGGVIYNKHTMELRFLVSPNPQATIWVHGFLEAGNAWDKFENYTPFQLKRSAGLGVRFFLPMFGLLGVDYGWGFDGLPPNNRAPGGQFHFMIGQQF